MSWGERFVRSFTSLPLTSPPFVLVRRGHGQDRVQGIFLMGHCDSFPIPFVVNPTIKDHSFHVTIAFKKSQVTHPIISLSVSLQQYGVIHWYLCNKRFAVVFRSDPSCYIPSSKNLPHEAKKRRCLFSPSQKGGWQDLRGT
jgi:hypothetical protein